MTLLHRNSRRDTKFLPRLERVVYPAHGAEPLESLRIGRARGVSKLPAAGPTHGGEGSSTGASAASGAETRPCVSRQAVCVGHVLVLAVTSICLALNVNRLDSTLYTLVRDLPSAGIVVWGVCMALAAAHRHWPSRCSLVDRAVGSPASRRVAWGVTLALATAAILIPRVFAHSERGLSLRVTDGWRSTDVGEPPRLVSQISFDETTGRPWTELPLTVAIDGWVYAPVGGRYHFELTARGDALLELDGVPHLGLGDHGATLRTPWATNPVTGARRAAIDLETGFHRLALIYRRLPEPARLRLRWTPPYVTRYRVLPADFLLAGKTSAEVRAGRSLALRSRRAGVLAIVLVLACPLGGLLARTRDRLVRRAAAPTATGPRIPGATGVRDTGSGRSTDGDRAS